MAFVAQDLHADNRDWLHGKDVSLRSSSPCTEIVPTTCSMKLHFCAWTKTVSNQPRLALTLGFLVLILLTIIQCLASPVPLSSAALASHVGGRESSHTTDVSLSSTKYQAFVINTPTADSRGVCSVAWNTGRAWDRGLGISLLTLFHLYC
jgi:hypothetical protein